MIKKLLFTALICLIPFNAFSASTDSCYDTDTVLMLHMDGSDTSTTFTDDSSSSKTVTAVTNAQIDTAQSVFGGASGFFGNDNSYLTIPDSTDWNFGTDPFTIDFRYRAVSDVTDIPFISHLQSGSNEWGFQTLGASPKLRFFQYQSGFNIDVQNAWSPSTGTWYHIALTKDGSGVYRMFVNGTQVGTDATDTTAIADFTGVIQIGKDGPLIGTQDMDGWLDEFRIVKGQAIWTSNFTPPSSAYTECVADRRVITV